MANNKTDLWTRLVNASRYSVSGLKAAYEHEQAFRLEIAVLAVTIPTALWLGETGMERALLIAVWVLVAIVELLNSAVEAVVDRIGLERHELAGRAKDCGSAAVFCSNLLALAVWALVLIPKL